MTKPLLSCLLGPIGEGRCKHGIGLNTGPGKYS